MKKIRKLRYFKKDSRRCLKKDTTLFSATAGYTTLIYRYQRLCI